MKKLMMVAAAFSALLASAEITITGVTARQRWPWNSLVDVDFTIGGVAQGEAYYVDVTATYDNGNRSLVAKTFETEPIAAAGKNRIVWDLGADYPNFKADDLRVTVTATPFSDATPLYLVVDISGGKDATAWPVRYTTTPPVRTAGVEDPCKTTELWLRRVKAGTMQLGKGSGSSNYGYYPQHKVTLTDDYYLGVFSLTTAQAANIAGYQVEEVSYLTNTLYAATRPCDALQLSKARGTVKAADNPTDTSILGRLAVRTGLPFDLPTEWQWEYALRAGSTADYYEGATIVKRPSGAIDRNSTTDAGTCYVDDCSPNAWGFYCVFGSVWDQCLNLKTTIEKDAVYTNPGVFSTEATGSVACKGVGCVWGYRNASPNQVGVFARSGNYSGNVSPTGWDSKKSGYGIRVLVPVTNSEVE